MMNKLAKITGVTLVALMSLMLGWSSQLAQAQVTFDIGVATAPPINAAVVHNTATEVELTWDASPNNPVHIAEYQVFYKLKTDASYPVTPQITRTDTLANYSETITVTADTGYDFKIYAESVSGILSADGCATCETTNATCGNNTKDPGETCDGTDLDGMICTDFGFIGGTLACDVTCDSFSFALCTSSGGGGGGSGDDGDSTAPQPGTASSPQYANGVITVTHSGASDSGGSGLSHVSLLAKRGTGSWIDTGLKSFASSGSFAYTPTGGDNTYYFDLVAQDNEGNISFYPTGGSGDTSTVYDTQRPTVESITIPTVVTEGSIDISYTNALDVGQAGLDEVQLWYKVGESDTWIDSGVSQSTADGTLTFSSFIESGDYYFDVVAVDRAGNLSAEIDETTTAVSIDTEHPIYEGASIEILGAGEVIEISYTGAVDVGTAGLKQVELWYKKGTDGDWMNSGLLSSETDDTFEFVPSSGDGTYFFDFVLEDNVGNRSPDPTNGGILSAVYSAAALEAVLFNLPPVVVAQEDFDITVGGEGIVAYRFKLNSDTYGDEISVSNPIQLIGLPEGSYALDVIGKNSANQWQDVSNPTSHVWTVDLSQPSLTVVGPLPSDPVTYETADDPVVYQLVYNDHDVVSLDIDDVDLIATGSADATVSISSQSFSVWLVTLSGITGVGTLDVDIAANTAAHANGNVAPGAGSGTPLIVDTTAPVEEPPIDEGEPDEEPGEDDEPPVDSGDDDDDDDEPPVESGDSDDDDDEPVVTEPDITPPEPEVTYTNEEIEQIAEGIMERGGVVERVPVRYELGDGVSEQVVTRIGECRRGYPGVDFAKVSLDSDNDGLSNRTECYAFTNPLLADTDNDGCRDGDEVNLYATDPLDSLDCRDLEEEKSVVISSPQPGWLVSKLEVTGLTHNDTSRVNLVAFPVLEGRTLSQNGVSLGSVSEFSESNIENNFFFESAPKTPLQDAQDYDLVAIGTLLDGVTIASKPIRFSLDSNAQTGRPRPVAIGNVPISDQITVENVQIRPSADGKVTVEGDSEFGSQVFAIWQSVVLVSSVVADSQEGSFFIESPQALDPDENHRVTLYAVKETEGQKLRSENVTIKFFIKERTYIVWILFGAAMLMLLAYSIYYQFYGGKRRKKKEKEKRRRERERKTKRK